MSIYGHTRDKSGRVKIAQELEIGEKAERTLHSVSESGRNLL